jgi:hypothetical protein
LFPIVFDEVAVRIRHPSSRHPYLEALQLALREPAGIVCIALVVAWIALAARIAIVW